MNLTELTLTALRPLEKLLKKKEALLDKVRQIDRQIEGFAGGIGSGGRKGRPPESGIGGGRKGLLKARIVKALQAAGQEGLHVVDLAKKAGVPVPNIRVWFYATGKKIQEISQIAPATYSWGGAAKASAKGSRRGGGKRSRPAGPKAKAGTSKAPRPKSRRTKASASKRGRKAKAVAAAKIAMPTEAL